MSQPDAVVVGSGPNGLAAAIAIAQTGRKVVVFESAATIGGACRSAELTLPGFVHDVCSAVHPFAVVSPFFRSLPLAAHGLEWIAPPVMLAHPLDGEAAVCLDGSIERTAHGLSGDGPAYRRLFEPLVASWPKIADAVLGPLRWPRHPMALARFGLQALRPATTVAGRAFAGNRARALLAGIAAHSMLPLERPPTGGIALALTIAAHVGGWYLPRGGAQRLADALGAYLLSLGGEVVTNTAIKSVDDLPPARAILCDLSPRPLLEIAGHRFPPRFRRALARYQYGMGVFKVDWALDGPVPWTDEGCLRAGTVHVGGTFEEIASSERHVWKGRPPDRPFVLVSQPTLFDPSRAPQGRHTLWAYCHVPHGSDADMLPRIEQQIERFAPGFRDRIIARAVRRPADIERDNANFVGGDIAGGATTLGQLFTRPTWRTYSTPVRGLYICSASTPPGVGVHGMCGYFAAQRALREVFRD
ncbi:MAG: phytoene desaturase family protein [Vicinamibacterales bacterium]